MHGLNIHAFFGIQDIYHYIIIVSHKDMRRIRLTESQLHSIVKTAVDNILLEYIGDAGEYGIYPNDEEPNFNPDAKEKNRYRSFDDHNFGIVGDAQFDHTNYSNDALADNQIVNA